MSRVQRTKYVWGNHPHCKMMHGAEVASGRIRLSVFAVTTQIHPTTFNHNTTNITVTAINVFSLLRTEEIMQPCLIRPTCHLFGCAMAINNQAWCRTPAIRTWPAALLWSFERVSICNFGCGHAITATQLPMQCAQCSVSVRVIQGALSIVFALDRAIAA